MSNEAEGMKRSGASMMIKCTGCGLEIFDECGLDAKVTGCPACDCLAFDEGGVDAKAFYDREYKGTGIFAKAMLSKRLRVSEGK